MGPKVPCDVRGSTRFLLLRSRAVVKSLGLRPEGSSSSDEDSESIGKASPSCSSSSPNNKNLRQLSRHGLLCSRIARRRRSMEARSFIDINGFRSKSTVGVPCGWVACGYSRGNVNVTRMKTEEDSPQGPWRPRVHVRFFMRSCC